MQTGVFLVNSNIASLDYFRGDLPEIREGKKPIIVYQGPDGSFDYTPGYNRIGYMPERGVLNEQK